MRRARCPTSCGISMSRNTTSGCVVAIAARASMASPASPTTSTSPASAEQLPQPRSRRRLVVDDEARGTITVPRRRRLASCSTSGSSMRATVCRRSRTQLERRLGAEVAAAGDRGRCAGRSSRRVGGMRGRRLSRPGPVSRTSRVRRCRPRDALTSMRPGVRSCEMPCLTAFSTSVCSSIDGTCARPSDGSASMENSSRRPKRACSTSRYARANASSWSSGAHSCSDRRSV